MILMDTGFLLALSQPADSLHRRAVAWSRVVSEPLVVTEYVLCETVNSLSKRVDRPRAHALLEKLRDSPQCRIIPGSPALFEEGLELHRAGPDKEWSLTDCISFVVMERYGIRAALAYDRHFEQAGFKALLRREPT